MSVPTRVACRHFKGVGKPCSFNTGLAFANVEAYVESPYAHPLVDTAEGVLASKGIAIGSQLRK